MNDELLERYIACEIAWDKFDTLLNLIFDSACLSWNGESLVLRNEDQLMNYVKAIAPNDYKRRFEALKKEEEKDEN